MASHDGFLIDWVKGAYGMELGLAPVLEQQTTQLFGEPELRKGLDAHLRKTRHHAELLRDYLERHGVAVSSIRPSEPLTNVRIRPNGGDPTIARQTELIDYVTESYEVANYHALRSLAELVGDKDAGKVFEQILEDEEAIKNTLDKRLPGHNGSKRAEHDNARIARNVIAALNDHNLESFERHLTSDFRLESPGLERPIDRKQSREMLKGGLAAFPDQSFDIRNIIAAGDDVAIEWVWSGTHTGPMPTPSGQAIAATGRCVQLRGTTIFRFRDGKIAEERDNFDTGEMMQQLGLMPAPAQAVADAIPRTGRDVVHLEIPAKDRLSAARFYKEMFGWAYQEAPEELRYTTFSTGTVPGGYTELAAGYKPGDVTFYVDSKDIDADLRKAGKLGAKTLVPRTEIPGMGWFAILSDPTGNRVGLFMGDSGM